MGKACLILFLVFITSCGPMQKKDVLYEDFESGDYDKWKMQGNAFVNPCYLDTVNDYALKNSANGDYCAYSYFNDGILNQGKLISPKFKIKHKYIDFLIGGGHHDTRTCINLLIDNKIVRTQVGFENTELAKSGWDVREYIGQHAIIEIVDALHSSPFDLDFILLDDIIFSDHNPRPGIIFEDFESGKFDHWTVEGDAFKLPGSRSNIYYPVTVNGFEGEYCAFSFGETHDKETGRLISNPFLIERDFISFLIGGGRHVDTTCVNLILGDNTIFSATGLNTGELRKEKWDVSGFQGEKARIEIRDNYTGNWGHIIADDFRFTDNPDDDDDKFYKQYYKTREHLTIIAIFVGALFLALGIYLLIRSRQARNISKPKLRDKDFLKTFKKLMEEDKIFNDPELSPKKMAKMLDLSTNEFLLKTEANFKLSFNDLLNEYRIESFKQEVIKNENKDFTLLSIAEKCGFSSKASFYRIFKKHTKITPTEYLKSIEN